jgi:hypothetical protein
VLAQPTVHTRDLILDDTRITYLGRTNHRNAGVPFGIRQKDRRQHLYICGKTGTGKSHLLRILFEQDNSALQGCALLDPHGDLAASAARSVQLNRLADLVYLDATDASVKWRLNPFTDVPPTDHARAAANLVEVFRKIWPDDWGPRLEHLWRNVALTLLETPESSLASVPALLADKTFRSQIVSVLENDFVRDFWTNEFDRYSPGFRSVVVAPLQNKVGALLADPVLRRLLTEPGTQIDFRRIIDDGKVLVANLDKGHLGEGPSALLGSLLMSQLVHAGLSRSDQPEDERRDFWIYADEFQTFTTLSVASLLSELRKYRIGAILANQHLSQLEKEIRDAVFGNVGTIISFRVGAADASFLSREFGERFEASDFTSLPRFSVYIRLLIEGETSPAFSATTLSAAEIDEILSRNQERAA